MHLLVMITALGVAIALRWIGFNHTGTQAERWHRALFQLLCPALLLLITAIAVICMGNQGQMFGQSVGTVSYSLAWGFLSWAIALAGILGYQSWRSSRKVRQYPQISLQGYTVRLLDDPALFSAQVGFWQPELVVTSGLLTHLTEEQLQAVFYHEQAHANYRDTFWFFGLGWLRRLTAWLPQTEALWQELLILRELRADGFAAQQVDALLLAETLLQVASQGAIAPEICCAAFSWTTPQNRLEERIEALLAEPEGSGTTNYWGWSWIPFTLLPLVMVPLHHL